MNHGIEQFFEEKARSSRRVSIASMAVGALMLGLFIPLTFLARWTPTAPFLRFGFEGPTRFVRMVQIESGTGAREPLSEVGAVVPLLARGGGGGAPTPSGDHAQEPQRGPRFEGTGDASRTLVARALAGEGQVPIFQSEDLILDRLVKPVYPDEAHDRGIEGKVAVLAHVDTAGRVSEAEVMTGSGTALLDRAALVAVRQCRFRPYRVDGRAREVYAIFRFAFRIY